MFAAVRESGVPVVLNQNGVLYPAWYPDGWELWNNHMAAAHAAASHVLYQSEFCRFCAGKFLGPRSGPSEILYNGVDTSRFFPSPALLDRQVRPFTFLVTGKIVPSTAHRLASAIDGLAEARRGGLDVRLTVAGHVDPACAGEAQALANRLGVAGAMAFGGPYAHAKAPDIYRSADAYLITKHNDPCPNVVLEALACGLPVLYSASGGIPELVGREAGVPLDVPQTFEANPVPDGSAIAAGMSRIIEGRIAMSRAARERAVDRFSLSAWLDRHEALFTSLLGTKTDA